MKTLHRTAALMTAFLVIATAALGQGSGLAQRKAAARGVLDMAFNQKQPARAVQRYMGPYYRQHNPHAPNGTKAFVAFATGYLKQFPKLRYNIKRVVGEGDLVFVHSHVIPKPGDLGSAVVDIFRFERGKIVEHWDVVQPVPAKSANRNTMF